VQDEWSFNDITEGMDVCDADGHTIGTVARVYHPAPATTQGGIATAHEDVVEVKSGFLGLGGHYYVPASGIQNLGEGCMVLNRSKDALDDWKSKPGYLEQ
jgi:hypothetical protein